jgi:hypothetical protein
MKMKPHEKSLGRNPLSDAPYRNSGMVLNGQEPARHPLGDAPYLDLDTVLNEQGSGHRILSDALHLSPGVYTYFVRSMSTRSHHRVRPPVQRAQNCLFSSQVAKAKPTQNTET